MMIIYDFYVWTDESLVCLYVFVRLWYCFILGSFVVLHQILRRILGKDLRRELRKVLLQYVRLLLYQSLCTKY